MSHNHEHDHHHHHHGHENEHTQKQLSESDKLIKMVEHWIHHGEEHARSYSDWARRARDMGHQEVYIILEEVASVTRNQNQHLEKVLDLLGAKP